MQESNAIDEKVSNYMIEIHKKLEFQFNTFALTFKDDTFHKALSTMIYEDYNLNEV